RLTVPSAFCAAEIATTSACRVTSCSCRTRLMDSATTLPSRLITTPYGYSPSRPDCTESAMQRCIISRSCPCASMRELRPKRASASLAERAPCGPPWKGPAGGLALHDDGALGAAAVREGERRGRLARLRDFGDR